MGVARFCRDVDESAIRFFAVNTSGIQGSARQSRGPGLAPHRKKPGSRICGAPLRDAKASLRAAPRAGHGQALRAGVRQGKRINQARRFWPASAGRIGSTVVAFTRSMAKREVTFLSGTAAIRRL